MTHESILNIFNEICSIDIEDDVEFEVTNVADIRKIGDYPGIRVFMKANYPPISVPLTVDVTTGDIITPKEIEYSLYLLFDERSISILAYNLETILAEKIETVLSRNIASTRPRDYYDLYTLYVFHGNTCDRKVLRTALENTTNKRGSKHILNDYLEIIQEIRNSDELNAIWKKYSKEYECAKDISFEETCNILEKIMVEIMNI